MKHSEIDNAQVLIQNGVAAAQVGRHLDGLKYHHKHLRSNPRIMMPLVRWPMHMPA